MRTAILLGALLFCFVFGAMTAAVAAQSSFDIFSLASFLIILMLVLAIIGALRHPPDK